MKDEDVIRKITEHVNKCANARGAILSTILRHISREEEYNIDTMFCREVVSTKEELQNYIYNSLKPDYPSFAEKYKKSTNIFDK